MATTEREKTRKLQELRERYQQISQWLMANPKDASWFGRVSEQHDLQHRIIKLQEKETSTQLPHQYGAELTVPQSTIIK